MYSIQAQRQALELRIRYFETLDLKAELAELREKLERLTETERPAE